MDDLPRSFVIRESSHRIHNPFTSEKLATLGHALQLSPGTNMLDLACGSGEMLCTWARDHGLTGTGVDISSAFIGAARARAAELDVADRVTFIHGDAAGYSPTSRWASLHASARHGSAAALPGLLTCSASSLGPGGIMLIGEPYWRRDPPDQATLDGCDGIGKEDWLPLPELIESFGLLGCDVVEMLLADQDSWDRYVAAPWLSIRRWRCRPVWQCRSVTGRCTWFHRAHERTEPEGRGCANERLADSRPRTARGFEPAGGGIAPCRPPGIPGAGFVLVQEFEGVMT